MLPHNFNLISIITSLALLTGCVTSSNRLVNFDHEAANQAIQNSFVSEFRTVCLYSKANSTSIRNKLPSKNWLVANDDYLKLGGLSALRKKVLTIPGGGGKFSHSQTLHVKITEENTYYLNVEERFYRKTLSSNYCALHAEENFLNTCEVLGQLMGRAPDKNQIYKSRDAHFISWSFKIDGNPATVSCERTPNSKVLPYKGTILSLIVENEI